MKVKSIKTKPFFFWDLLDPLDPKQALVLSLFFLSNVTTQQPLHPV